MAELPVAVQGLHHAGGRLTVGQEQQHWLVLGQALRDRGTAEGTAERGGASLSEARLLVREGWGHQPRPPPGVGLSGQRCGQASPSGSVR